MCTVAKTRENLFLVLYENTVFWEEFPENGFLKNLEPNVFFTLKKVVFVLKN